MPSAWACTCLLIQLQRFRHSSFEFLFYTLDFHNFNLMPKLHRLRGLFVNCLKDIFQSQLFSTCHRIPIPNKSFPLDGQCEYAWQHFDGNRSHNEAKEGNVHSILIWSRPQIISHLISYRVWFSSPIFCVFHKQKISVFIFLGCLLEGKHSSFEMGISIFSHQNVIQMNNDAHTFYGIRCFFLSMLTEISYFYITIKHKTHLNGNQ